MKKVIFLVNNVKYFLSHRLDIAVEAKKSGYDVHVAAPSSKDVDNDISTIKNLGFTYHSVRVQRGKQSIINEFKGVYDVFTLFINVRPDLVHLVTLKQVVIGGFLARVLGVRGSCAAIAGLGSVFISSSKRDLIIRFIFNLLARFIFGKSNLRVIFQNINDQNYFIDSGLLVESKSVLIPGSGVNLIEFPYSTEQISTPVVIMASRLLRDKGVFEFAEAARILKEEDVKVIFKLVGEIDQDNSSSLSMAELDLIVKEGNVQYLGYSDDIAKDYAESHIVCLPSYREGLPKSLIEAAACGRPIVTTDVPGCRDAVISNITGILVPPRDSVKLASAIKRFVEDASLRKKMGLSGRQLAEDKFSIQKIVSLHMDVYADLIIMDK
ncbi:glycosyltransferase family 4 protein [Candidatus Pelagadaptatus aseana]|uniref:glycosyltransferase family 4 protein n=1 Tax=Candidatus Pelagadaptatus aseana TaxID=3120508 RepID=UPI003C6F9315